MNSETSCGCFCERDADREQQHEDLAPARRLGDQGADHGCGDGRNALDGAHDGHQGRKLPARMQVGRNRAGHHDRTRDAEPLEKAHRDEGLDVGRKNRTRRRERKDREARRERNPAPAGVGKRTDPELPGGKPPHRGGKTELHHRGGRAEVDRLIRKRRKIEVGHERTKGGEKRQEDDQKGTGVSRRALFVNGCRFCSVLVRCGCRMRRRRIERRLGLRVDDPILSANLVQILRLA